SGLLLEEDDGEVVLDAQGLPIVIEDYGALTLRAKKLFDNNYDEESIEDLEDLIEEDDPDSFGYQSGNTVFFPYLQNNEEELYDNSSIQHAFYGISLSSGTISQGVGRFGVSDLSEHYIDPQSLLDGTSGAFVGLKLFSRSKGSSKSGSFSSGSLDPYFSAQGDGTYSSGTSISENRYIDLNGDGYPDLVTKNTIQYTNSLGALSFTKSNAHAFIERSEEKDFTVGTTLAGFSPTSESDKSSGSSKNKTNTNINSGVNNSEGYSYDASQWIDINGDGLPDQVRITESGI